ncbi:uncharacterized protein LOC126995868 isoform X4 [Eriocheir sinensis]|uniref:uncharacterized protein LOC126995868 isoform X4 n=1 Tax=Eriocheir sinensis TaxID=95602 RepID=UPI0021C568DA|nr:uncharacterized protein LOC126995868 isoform X4 [Eriocheir sinensis]
MCCVSNAPPQCDEQQGCDQRGGTCKLSCSGSETRMGSCGQGNQCMCCVSNTVPPTRPPSGYTCSTKAVCSQNGGTCKHNCTANERKMDGRGLCDPGSYCKCCIPKGANHPCQRPCVAGDNRTCLYEFHMQTYHTLSRACYDCPQNLTDCSRKECIPGDGVSRPLVVVNRELPGPSLQVCEGDRLLVDVHNSVLGCTDSIHWHGIHMKNQQYYDGVPYLTQCPIAGNAFRYDFRPDDPGTYWWHSHSGLNRGEGVFGALVVRQAEDPHRNLYDTDLPDHVMVIHDWGHVPITSKFASRHHSTDDDFVRTILINGKGRNTAIQAEQGVGATPVPLPLEVIKVVSGKRHRLRIISTSVLNCPVIVSVDGHRLTIIATDGSPIKPFATDSFVIYAAERFDVVIEANQTVDNYWIRFNGLIDCQQLQCVQGAVLRYDGAPDQDPTAPLTYTADYPSGVVVNPLNTAGDAPEEVTIAELDALVSSSLSTNVDKKFYLGFDFHRVNNTLIYNPYLYPYNGVGDEWRINSPMINGIAFKHPQSPPLSQPYAETPTLCKYDETPLCEGDFCSCFYVLEVDLHETVEFVLVDEGNVGDENHPFHLHGYNFEVVAIGRIGSMTTVAEVKALDAAGGINRKLENAAKKDTVTIPDGGYVVIRFTADNPGWWLMHCHLLFHNVFGMAAALHVGKPEDLPPVPEGFPTCGDFVPPYD